MYKKDPVAKVIRTTANLTKFKTQMNTKLLKILERIELDRPILMKEKVDVLWNQYNAMMPEMQIVRSQITKKKVRRMHVNTELRAAY